MNADAYLRKQGWRGSGHSLDSTDRGIKKPLLIAHKQDQLGLGKKKAAYSTDDQWWMRAYDQSLQSIGTGKESTLNQIRTQGINRGGLYGFFVKGEAIQGTIEDTSATTTDASVAPSGTSTPATSASDAEGASTSKKSAKKSKRKREDTETSESSKKNRKSTKAAKLVKKEAIKAAEMDAVMQKRSSGSSDSNEHAAVTAKLAKLKPAEKAEYQARASEKGQSLEQYVLRRIQKKDEKRAKYVNPPSDSPYFFVDLEGDPNHRNQRVLPYTYYKPQPDRLLPLGLDPTVWEKQVSAFMNGGDQAEQCDYDEGSRRDTVGIAASEAPTAARKPKRKRQKNKRRLHSTSPVMQLPSSDPTGDEDDLVPATLEDLDEGHWATSLAIRKPEKIAPTSPPKTMATAVADTEADMSMETVEEERQRQIVDERYAALIKKSKAARQSVQKKWEIRLDS